MTNSNQASEPTPMSDSSQVIINETQPSSLEAEAPIEANTEVAAEASSDEPQGMKETPEEKAKPLDDIQVSDGEKFIPLTRFAIMNRLTEASRWRDGEADDAKRFFRYLAAWRHQTYNEQLLTLKEAYMPFSPDRDTIRTMEYSKEQLRRFQKSFIDNVTQLLEQANYTHISSQRLNKIFEQQSIYNLDLEVDLSEFEEMTIYCRGEMIETKQRRTWRKLYLGFEEYTVPIFQRLFLLLKLKTEEQRLGEIMESERRKNDGSPIERKKAEKIMAKKRAMLPPGICCDHIYLKLFKNIPTTDLEMMFPNTKVRFRPLDKIKLGITAGGGTIASIAGTAGKLLLITTNPIKAIGALVGIIAVIGRQIMKFFHQRNEYMMVLAQNLYFHNLADNRGSLTLLADRAEEEDIKEEMLLYSVLSKEDVHRSQLPLLQVAIENYLSEEFNVNVDYDIMDALQRLLHDGVVTEANGILTTMRPKEGCDHIDAKWDAHLDTADFFNSGQTENA